MIQIRFPAEAYMRNVFDELWEEFKYNPDFRILSITLFVFLIICVFGFYTMCEFV